MTYIDLETMAHLSALYTQPHRHYHNLNHVNYCLRQLDLCEAIEAEDYSNVIELFIWFHDSVYDPLSKYNEIRSAKLFEDWYGKKILPITRPGYTDKLFTPVYDGIIDSIDHVNRTKNKIIDYMLDIDLSILGSKTTIYLDYRNNIRKEYEQYSLEEYCSGRKIVLNNILNRPSIYKTDYFKDRYEQKARKNIQKEIDYLISL